MQLSYPSIRSENAKVAHERNLDKHCLQAVGILKQATDKEDKYIIYKINNSQFAAMAELAIDMDHDGPEHPLQGEESYFDGCYSCMSAIKFLHYLCIIQPCGTYLDWLLWTLKESTHDISLFWKLFNEIFWVKLRGEITNSTQNQ